jgi:hypothetical protein
VAKKSRQVCVMQVNEAKGNKDRIEPILQFSVLCDGVAQDPNGKMAFIGVFESLVRPATVPQFFIVNKWINGQGTFRQSVEILTPDLRLNGGQPSLVQEFALLSQAAGNLVVVGFVNYVFNDTGVYWVQIKLDDEMVMAYPLPVFQPSASIPR